MGFDAILRKHVFLVFLGLAASATYFQASAIGSVAAAALLPEVGQLTTLPKAPVPPPAAVRAKKSAASILSRNPFDSVIGSLLAQDALTIPASSGEGGPNDPLRAPRCAGIRVDVVVEASSNSLGSLATLQGPGEPKPAIRRVGDYVGTAQVLYIGFNAYEGKPSVWLRDEGKLCQLLLFATQPVPGPVPVASADPVPPHPPTDFAAFIQPLSPTEFNLDRRGVERLLEDPSSLMRLARVVPEAQDGKVIGIRLFGIRPDAVLGKLGIQNGDRVESVNGFDISGPDKALEAFVRVRTAGEISLKIVRRGQPVTIDLHVK